MLSPKTEIAVRQAVSGDVEVVAPLFDAYRQFYGQPSDLALAQDFLRARLEKRESVIFIATTPTNAPLGFTQLYPSFSSVSAARIFILNDLYVTTEVRRRGVAQRLLAAAEDYGRSAGAVRLTLSTAVRNEAAQALYLSCGWQPDEEFIGFELSLLPSAQP